MKAESSQIPQKLAARLKFVYCLRSLERIPATTVFRKCWHLNVDSALCPSVRWLQRILDVCQAYAESHGIIFNCNKTVCMTFKAKSARCTATPVLKLGGQYVNSVDQYKYLGIVLDTELSDDKDIQRQLRYQYCAANKLRASFPVALMQLKTYFFVPFVRPCMHLNYV